MDQAEEGPVKSAKYCCAGNKSIFHSQQWGAWAWLLMQVFPTQKKSAGQGRVSVRYSAGGRENCGAPTSSLAMDQSNRGRCGVSTTTASSNFIQVSVCRYLQETKIKKSVLLHLHAKKKNRARFPLTNRYRYNFSLLAAFF
jgi:hypothetical protein